MTGLLGEIVPFSPAPGNRTFLPPPAAPPNLRVGVHPDPIGVPSA